MRVAHGRGESIRCVRKRGVPVAEDAHRGGAHARLGGSEELPEPVRFHGSQTLEDPESLEAVMLEVLGFGLEFLDPLAELRQDLVGAAFPQDAARLIARPVFGKLQGSEHGLRLRLLQPRWRDERSPLLREPPDAAVAAISQGVVEVDLAVIDDRAVPVGHVDRSVGSHLHVNGTEGTVRGGVLRYRG